MRRLPAGQSGSRPMCSWGPVQSCCTFALFLHGRWQQSRLHSAVQFKILSNLYISAAPNFCQQQRPLPWWQVRRPKRKLCQMQGPHSVHYFWRKRWTKTGTYTEHNPEQRRTAVGAYAEQHPEHRYRGITNRNICGRPPGFRNIDGIKSEQRGNTTRNRHRPQPGT